MRPELIYYCHCKDFGAFSQTYSQAVADKLVRNGHF